MKQALLDFWGERNTRERIVLAVGSTVLGLGLLYAYGWMPVRSEVARLTERLPELRAGAAQMREEAAEIGSLRKRTIGDPAGGVLSAIEQSSSAAGLRDKIGELASTDPAHVRITSASMPFDQWVSWLAQLQAQFGVRVESARVDALPEPGLVRIQAVLTKS